MAFGKHETFDDDLITYKESVDMILIDLKLGGYRNLTKDKLNKILQNNFSIGAAVKAEISRILDSK